MFVSTYLTLYVVYWVVSNVLFKINSPSSNHGRWNKLDSKPVELVQAWGAALDPQFFLNIDQKWTTIPNEQIV